LEKYLIIRFSSIGDIVLTSPIIRCLRSTYPNAKIHYVTKKVYAPLLENNPNVNRIFTIEKEITEIVEELKLEQYDFVIDLHKNLRTFRLKRKLNRPSAAFPKMNLKKFLLTRFKWNRMPEIHIVDRYFEAVKKVNVVNDQKGLDFFIQETDRIALLDYNIPPNFIAFSIGGQFATKKLPVSKIVELIQKIDSPVVLLGGPEDMENGNIIASECPNGINLCGKLSLLQSASVLEQAVKVITHDTGLMHIASAFKKPIISIWGNTVPAFGMYPYQPQNTSNFSIHQVSDLSCRPCSKIGYQSCPKKHFKCMKDHDLDAIAEQTQRL